MTTFVDKLVAEEHHLEEIAREGYEPATLPIVLGLIVLALVVIVGLLGTIPVHGAGIAGRKSAPRASMS